MRILYASLSIVSVRFGDGFGGTVQNFRPKPSRFLVPGGGCEFLHRLWTARFFGCSSNSELGCIFWVSSTVLVVVEV